MICVICKTFILQQPTFDLDQDIHTQIRASKSTLGFPFRSFDAQPIWGIKPR